MCARSCISTPLHAPALFHPFFRRVAASHIVEVYPSLRDIRSHPHPYPCPMALQGHLQSLQLLITTTGWNRTCMDASQLLLELPIDLRQVKTNFDLLHARNHDRASRLLWIHSRQEGIHLPRWCPKRSGTCLKRLNSCFVGTSNYALRCECSDDFVPLGRYPLIDVNLCRQDHWVESFPLVR